MLYPKICPLISQVNPHFHTQEFLKGWPDEPTPKKSTPQLGFWFYQVKDGLYCHKWSSYLLICLKVSPCQVSSLTAQVCSFNCSYDWKSLALDKKSIMANMKSNFIMFGQHQDFEVTFIIWSRVDHESSRKLKIWSKVKVSKLGFLDKKSTELWSGITFTYFIRNFNTKAHFWDNSIL